MIFPAIPIFQPFFFFVFSLVLMLTSMGLTFSFSRTSLDRIEKKISPLKSGSRLKKGGFTFLVLLTSLVWLASKQYPLGPEIWLVLGGMFCLGVLGLLDSLDWKFRLPVRRLHGFELAAWQIILCIFSLLVSFTLPETELIFRGAVAFLSDRVVGAAFIIGIVFLFTQIEREDALQNNSWNLCAIGAFGLMVLLMALACLALGISFDYLAWINIGMIFCGASLGVVYWLYPFDSMRLNDGARLGVGFLIGYLLLKLLVLGWWFMVAGYLFMIVIWCYRAWLMSWIGRVLHRDKLPLGN